MKQFDADIGKYDIVKQKNLCVLDPESLTLFIKAKSVYNGVNFNKNTSFSVNSVTKHFCVHQGNFVDMVAVNYDIKIMAENGEDCLLKSNKTMVFSDFDTQSLNDVGTKVEDDKLWQAYRLFCDGGSYALRLEEFKKARGDFVTEQDKKNYETELLKNFIWIKNFVTQQKNATKTAKADKAKEFGLIKGKTIPANFDYSLVVKSVPNNNAKIA